MAKPRIDHSRDAEVVDKLRMLCRAWGGRTEFAATYQFSRAYISMVINGQQPPSRRLTETVDRETIAQETYYG
jgi:hypothetical protein